jgi:hypothetical protein
VFDGDVNELLKATPDEKKSDPAVTVTERKFAALLRHSQLEV